MRLADASTLLTRRSPGGGASLDLGWSGPPQLREAVRGVVAALLGALLGSERAPAVTIEQAPAEVRVKEEAVPSTPPVETLTGEAPVGYLGSSLASCDIDADGEADLAVGAYGDGENGAAQRGAVVLAYANGTRASLRAPCRGKRASAGRSPPSTSTATACATSRSAPKASWGDEEPLLTDAVPHLRLWGRVYVYRGARGVGVRADDAPWLTLSAHTDLTALGASLATGDIDGDGDADLLVGAPSSSACFDAARPATECIQRGALYVVKARASWPKQELDVHADADLAIEGPAAYDFFGQALAVATVGGARAVLVGAPGHRNRTGSTAGAVYLFALHNSGGGGALSASLALTIEGEEPLASSATPSPSVAARCSRSRRRRRARGDALRGGEVRLIPIANVSHAPTANRTVGLSALPAAATLRGTAAAGLRLGRLGRALAWVDGGLVVAAPLATTGDAREGGAVFAWPAASLPTGVVDDVAASAAWSVRGNRTRGRLGAALAAAGRGRLGVGAAGGRRRERWRGGGGLRDRVGLRIITRDTRRTG